MRFLLGMVMILICGEYAEGETWTYTQCVEYARQHNISLKKLRLAEQTADYTLEESKAQWEPSLDFSTSQGYVNTPWGKNNKNAYNSSYGLNAGWTVWNGGQRQNSIKRNELQTQISRIDTNDMIRTLETQLLQVYINILYAKESIGIYEEAVKLSKAQAERAEALMQSGRLSRVDYAQLNAQYEQDKYSLVNAQTTYESRRMELKQILELGIDSEVVPAPVEWTSAQVLAELPPISESYALALATDLQMQSLALGKEASEYDVKIAKSGKYPQINLNAGVGTGYYAPGGSFGEGLKQGVNEQIGLSLNIPVFDNKKTKTAVAKAKVQQLDTQLDIDNREKELSQLVETWYIDTRSSQARFTAAEQQLQSTLLSNELTNERFVLGYINPVELLQSHNALTEARHSLIQAKYMAMLGQKMIEYYRTATITL